MRRRGEARAEALASMSAPEPEGGEDESRIQEATEAIKRLTPPELEQVLASLSSPAPAEEAEPELGM